MKPQPKAGLHAAVPQTMQAAVLTALNRMELRDIPMPVVGPGEVLLKVASCAICGSDRRIMTSGNDRVAYPAVIGHEISGEIVMVADGVEGWQPGDRVALGADVPCGECSWCRNDMGNCCDINYAIGYQFPGGFAEYCLLNKTVVRHGPLTKIPEGVSMDAAALAEPLACCLNGFERVHFSRGKTVLIIGAGPIGLMLAQLARHLGASMIVIADIDEARLKVSSRFTFDHMVHAAGQDIVSQVQKITHGRGMDVVFTACAVGAVQQQAVQCVAKRGWVNFFGGLPKTAGEISISSNWLHYREANLTGSHGSVPRQHRMAVDLISKNNIDVQSLITHYFSLDQIVSAFETSALPSALKVVVRPGTGVMGHKHD